MKTNGGDCLICGAENSVTNHVKFREIKEVVQDGQEYTAQLPLFYSLCSNCGSEFAGRQQTRMASKCMKAFLKGRGYYY